MSLIGIPFAPDNRSSYQFFVAITSHLAMASRMGKAKGNRILATSYYRAFNPPRPLDDESCIRLVCDILGESECLCLHWHLFYTAVHQFKLPHLYLHRFTDPAESARDLLSLLIPRPPFNRRGHEKAKNTSNLESTFIRSKSALTASFKFKLFCARRETDG